MLREVKGNTSLSAPHTDCSICLILINGEFYRMDTITVGVFFVFLATKINIKCKISKFYLHIFSSRTHNYLSLSCL